MQLISQLTTLRFLIGLGILQSIFGSPIDPKLLWGNKSDSKTPKTFEILALYDHIEGVVYYKDEAYEACFLQHFQNYDQHTDQIFLIPDDPVHIPKHKINSTVAHEFCEDFPIYAVALGDIARDSESVTNNKKSHSRNKRATGNGHSGYYYPSKNGASQYQIQGQVSGQGPFSGQAQSQLSGASQSQVQLSGSGILGSLSSSAGNAEAQIALGKATGSGQAGSSGVGPSNSQVQVNVDQEGRRSMASAIVLSGGDPSSASRQPRWSNQHEDSQNLNVGTGYNQRTYPPQSDYQGIQDYSRGQGQYFPTIGATNIEDLSYIQSHVPRVYSSYGIPQGIGNQPYISNQVSNIRSYQSPPTFQSILQSTHNREQSPITGQNLQPQIQHGRDYTPQYFESRTQSRFDSGESRGTGNRNILIGSPQYYSAYEQSSLPSSQSGNQLSNINSRSQGVSNAQSSRNGQQYTYNPKVGDPYSQPTSYGHSHGAGDLSSSNRGSLPQAFASSYGGGQAQAQTVYLGSGTSDFYDPRRVTYGSESYPGSGQNGNGYRSQAQYASYNTAFQNQDAQRGGGLTNGNRYGGGSSHQQRTPYTGGNGQLSSSTDTDQQRAISSDGYIPTDEGYVKLYYKNRSQQTSQTGGNGYTVRPTTHPSTPSSIVGPAAGHFGSVTQRSGHYTTQPQLSNGYSRTYTSASTTSRYVSTPTPVYTRSATNGNGRTHTNGYSSGAVGTYPQSPQVYCPQVQCCTIVTFTCTLVLESQGRAKICRPNTGQVNGNGGHYTRPTSPSRSQPICCC